MEKKKVLMVTGMELCVGGVTNVLLEIVRQLKDRFSFDLLSFSGKEGELDSEFLGYGGKIFRHPLIQYTEHKFLYPWRATQIEKALSAILQNDEYSVIHCHNGIDSGVCLKVAHKYGVPIRISHAHGNYMRRGKNAILLMYNSLCKDLLRKYSTVRLACSNAAGVSLFSQQEFHNILNPIDYCYLNGIKHKEHIGLNLVQIGVYVKNKNQEFSITLLKSLVDSGIDATLTLVGYSIGDGYEEKLRSMTNELSIGNRVLFADRNTDKENVFAEADILLLPSYSEGLPLVALEAQAAGIRCYASENVPADICLGLALRIRHNDVLEWKKRILAFQSDGLTKDAQALECLDNKVFSARISMLYQTGQ